MLKIGITGGIGSGKSTVAKVFQTLGIPVFDADAVAKDIMNNDEEVQQQLIKTFGGAVFKNGTLDRKYLAALVFENEQLLQKLNRITHPATINAAANWIQQQSAVYVIKEAALLFESGTAGSLDFIIGVYAPLALRIHRVMQRDNISRDAVMQRVNRQIDEEIKMKLCNAVLINDEQQLLLPQIIALHKKFTSTEIKKS